MKKSTLSKEWEKEIEINNLNQNKKNKMKEDLIEYKKELEKYIQEHEEEIKKLKKKEYYKYKTDYIILKEMKHLYRLELEEICLNQIEKRKKWIEQSRYIFDHRFIKDRDHILNHSKEIIDIWNMIQLKKLELDKYQLNSIDKFYNENLKEINNFLKQLKDYGYEKIPIKEIHSYIQQIIKKNSLIDKKIFFSLISNIYLKIEMKQNPPKYFYSKIPIMNPLDIILQNVIDEMNQLSFLSDPDEMMDCIMNTFSLIYSFQIKNADELIPVIEYILYSSNIIFIESILSFIKKFKKLSSEQDYYITVLSSIIYSNK